jgi:zinc transport system ATP-binding protein
MSGASDAPGSREVLAFEDVTFGYTSAPVVEDVSFTVERGEFTALVGPNGSGKSTLLKIGLGLLTPGSGEARLFGRPAAAFEDGERIGYVAQHAAAAKSMPITVREVVTMGRFAHVGFGRLTREDRRAVDDALDRVGMTAYADRRITQLSGGQRQRAFIARALATDADLLVLDEPTVGVDVESVAEFYDLVRSLNADGITVFLVEHDLGAVANNAERVLCLNRELFFDGTASEFVDSDALARTYGTDPQTFAEVTAR